MKGSVDLWCERRVVFKELGADDAGPEAQRGGGLWHVAAVVADRSVPSLPSLTDGV